MKKSPYLFLPLYPFFACIYRFNRTRSRYPKVRSSLESLDLILQEGKKLSVSRFGDGELRLLFDRPIGFQPVDTELKDNLSRVLSDPPENCRLAIPDIFRGMKQFTLKARLFWMYTLARNWPRWKQVLRPDYHYLDTQVSRFYMDIADKRLSREIIERWKRIWNGRDIVMIEGETTRMGVGNDLFDNARSIERIPSSVLRKTLSAFIAKSWTKPRYCPGTG